MTAAGGSDPFSEAQPRIFIPSHQESSKSCDGMMHIIGHSERVNRKPAESHPSTPVFMQDEFVCTPADLGLNDCSSFWNLDQNYEDFSPQAGKPIYHLMTNIGSALCSQKSTRFG